MEQGITASNGKGAPLAEMPEVSLALCILSCISNPHNDIKLAGALRSPVFGLTLDELICIKREKKKGSLFSSSLHSSEVESGYNTPDSSCLLPRCHHHQHLLFLILHTDTSIAYLSPCHRYCIQCLKDTYEIIYKEIYSLLSTEKSKSCH